MWTTGVLLVLTHSHMVKSSLSHIFPIEKSHVLGEGVASCWSIWSMGYLICNKSTKSNGGFLNGKHMEHIYIYWLVVWNHGILYFSIYWECHHPNWRTHIFQRGRYSTNQYIWDIHWKWMFFLGESSSWRDFPATFEATGGDIFDMWGCFKLTFWAPKGA